VVRYSEATREAHQEFAGRMWRKRRRREDRYIRWKFRGPESGEVEGLLLAVQDGQVLGQLGLLPATLQVGVGIYPCQWACDLMVSPAHRRRGIASLLLARAMARSCITLGSNPSPGADRTMAAIGFQALEGPRVMVLPLDPSHVLGWKTPQLLAVAIPVLASLARPLVRVRASQLTRATGPQPAALCRWQEVAGRIEERERKIEAPHIVHDRSFLEWRCTGLSGFSAELLGLRAGSGWAVVGPADRYFYVYDWWAQDHDDYLSLFRAVYRMAQERRNQTVMALAPDATAESWLDAAGFLRMRRPVKVVHYPAAPLARAQSGFHYCVYDSDGNL